MRVRYDQEVDAITIELKSGVAIDESDEMAPGVILDFDGSGDLVAIEVVRQALAAVLFDRDCVATA